MPDNLVPLTNAIEIGLVWGLKGYQQDNVSAPEFDGSFNFFAAEVQAWIHETCTLASADPELLVREEMPCWIIIFSEVLASLGASFPINNSALASEALQVFFHDRNVVGFQKDIATDGDDYAGRITFTRVRVKVNMAANGDVGKRSALRKKWETFVEARNSAAPAMAGTMFMVSTIWTQMELESRVLSSTTMAFAGSILTCLAAIILFTQSGVVAVAVLVDILLVVGLLAGVLLKVLEFEFGVVEAFGATMFVGMGVDYCLHLAHGYHEAPGRSSKDKIKHALIVLGPSILGGALTTIAGVAFLVPCRMVLFSKLGWLLLLNAVFSVFYTFIFLAPLLMIIGHLANLCGRRSNGQVADSSSSQLDPGLEPSVMGKNVPEGSAKEAWLHDASNENTVSGLRAAASMEEESVPTLNVEAKMVSNSIPGASSNSFPDGNSLRVDEATGSRAAASDSDNDPGRRPKVRPKIMGKSTTAASKDSSEYSSASSGA